MLTQLSDRIALTRDCEGVLIPEGRKVILPQGSVVLIKQALGGDYTVRTDCGEQVRIAGHDADALGKPLTAPPPGVSLNGAFTENTIWKQLEQVFDPEIPISIVELGLVYAVEPKPLPDGSYRVEILMTLTAPGCGMGEILKQDVERKVRAVPGVSDVAVEITFDPPWNQNMMSEAARLQLGLF